MEPWEIVALALIFAGVYLGKITITEMYKSRDKNAERENEKERIKEIKSGYEKIF